MNDSKTDEAEVGTCALCGQEMIRTADDCWHPWNVAKACPPEPSSADFAAYSAWRAAGNESLRPGRQHFIPADRDVEWTVQS